MTSFTVDQVGCSGVSEALATERVRVDELEGKLLVTFRHMTVREIEVRTGKSTAVLLPTRTPNKEDGSQ